MSTETPVQNAIDRLDRVAELRAMRELAVASASMHAARVAGNEQEEMAARQIVDRSYHQLQNRWTS